MSRPPCSYPDCGRPNAAKGYCSVHYYQLRRTGTVFPILPRDRPKTTCKYEDCSEPHFARGWCRSHHRSEYVRYARWGLTKEQFEALVQDQGGGCAICQVKPDVFLVDHDHTCCPGQESCGRCVRGLLCATCNTGIGMFRDDLNLLGSAIVYLERMRRGEAPPLSLAV